MAKFSATIIAALVASASAFVSQKTVSSKTSLKAAEIWDPMGFYELSEGKSFDTFKAVFPDKQFLQDAEIKHGRQAMLAWTGVWATHEVGNFMCRDVIVGELVSIAFTRRHSH
jgi:hypothetical protein